MQYSGIRPNFSLEGRIGKNIKGFNVNLITKRESTGYILIKLEFLYFYSIHLSIFKSVFSSTIRS